MRSGPRDPCRETGLRSAPAAESWCPARHPGSGCGEQAVRAVGLRCWTQRLVPIGQGALPFYRRLARRFGGFPDSDRSVHRQRLRHQASVAAQEGVELVEGRLGGQQLVDVALEVLRLRAVQENLATHALVHDLEAASRMTLNVSEVGELDHAKMRTVIDHVHIQPLTRCPPRSWTLLGRSVGGTLLTAISDLLARISRARMKIQVSPRYHRSGFFDADCVNSPRWASNQPQAGPQFPGSDQRLQTGSVLGAGEQQKQAGRLQALRDPHQGHPECERAGAAWTAERKLDRLDQSRQGA